MYNDLFSIGGLTVHGYGLCIGIGIAALCLGLGGGGGCLTLHGRYHGVHGFCLPVVERQGLVLGVAQHVGARAGVHGLYLLFAAAAAHILVLCILHCGEV